MQRPLQSGHSAVKLASEIRLVPRRGLEPPRVAPLVPETSASTNSATSAGVAGLRCSPCPERAIY